MSRIGIAVIGLGAAVQPHAQSLVELAARVDVRWAMSRSEAKASAFSAKFPFPTTTDIEQVLADPTVEAVIVLTPPNAHFDVAETVFAAGKHVLIEKPLELTVERGARLVAAGHKAGRKLGVVLQHRFRPGARRLREILAKGELGAIAFAQVGVPWWRPQAYYDEPGRGTLTRDGGGVLLTQGIHAIDLFRSLVGVSDVSAAHVGTTAHHQMETEDYASALLTLGNGAPGVLTATTAMYPGNPDVIEISGLKGSAVLRGGTLTVSYRDGREETVVSEGNGGAGANIMDFPNEPHRRVIEDFLDAIRDDRPPLVSGEEALETQKLIERIIRVGSK